MTLFHQRITIDEAEHAWQAAEQAGLLGPRTRSLLVHDLQRMRERIAMLHEAFPTGTLHALAIKANPLVEVLHEAVEAGAGLEAASMEEAQLALAAGCAPHRIVLDSPAKTAHEIEEALRLGISLNADNLEELARIGEHIAPHVDPLRGSGEHEASIGLRVNPEVASGAISLTSVGSRGSKFGESIFARREEIIASFARYRWLNGLHVHVGSQGCGLDSFCDAVERAAALAKEVQAATGRPLRVLDIGGGLPAAYRDQDRPPTPAEYAERLRLRVPELFDPSAAPPPRLITEFGRSVQAGCGVALSRVEYVRDQPPMAVIHLGADFLLRPVYRPEHWQHEFFVLDASGKRKTGAPGPVSIVGPLCFAGDVLARDLLLPPVDPGDWVVIRDTGAYTLSMWSRHCSRAIPAVIGYDEAAPQPVRVLREAESEADVVAFWSRAGNRQTR